MITIKPGAFNSGDSTVIVDKMFQIAETPVTVKQYRLFAQDRAREYNPQFSLWCLPATEVSWYDAVAYCEWLSDMALADHSIGVDQEYRLPTSDEWEWASRSDDGVACEDQGVLDDMAWYAGKSNGRPQHVGMKHPNSRGIYDMLGNIWEWTITTDRWRHVIRGGSWDYTASHCRSAFRSYDAPATRSNDIGFRVVLATVDGWVD